VTGLEKPPFKKGPINFDEYQRGATIPEGVIAEAYGVDTGTADGARAYNVVALGVRDQWVRHFREQGLGQVAIRFVTGVGLRSMNDGEEQFHAARDNSRRALKRFGRSYRELLSVTPSLLSGPEQKALERARERATRMIQFNRGYRDLPPG